MTDESSFPRSIKSGLTGMEDACHTRLMQCMDVFMKLPIHHPDERRVFVDAVHVIQGLLMERVVRRDYPEFWRKVEPVEEAELKYNEALENLLKRIDELEANPFTHPEALSHIKERYEKLKNS